MVLSKMMFCGLVGLAYQGEATRTASGSTSGAMATYASYRKTFAKTGDDGVSFDERFSLFQKRMQEVEAHNADETKTWTATFMNKFADMTPQEFYRNMGYTRTGDWAPGGSAASDGASFLQRDLGAETRSNVQVGAEVSWVRDGYKVPEQGGCGSCWAVATASAVAMRLAHEMNATKLHQFSYEQLVSCVPNPRHCGGNGGCKGATGELALDWILSNGLAQAHEFQGYQHGQSDAKCTVAHNKDRDAVFIHSWKQFDTNAVRPVLEALYNDGPVIASVAANPWGSYSKGIFNGCQKDAVVNHAVAMVGFGADQGKLYWTIQNSWGELWGEDGYMRVLRHVGDGDYCGIDSQPQDGVGCDGGPATLPVCGMCGILSDVSAPIQPHLFSGKRLAGALPSQAPKIAEPDVSASTVQDAKGSYLRGATLKIGEFYHNLAENFEQIAEEVGKEVKQHLPPSFEAAAAA